MSSHLPYTLALRTVHAGQGYPFTQEGWLRARAELKKVYGPGAKAGDKAGSQNGWQAALKQAGKDLKGTGIKSAKQISDRAHDYYTTGSAVGLTKERAWTQKNVRDWIKSTYGARAPYIKLDDALYVMLRHFTYNAGEHVLTRWIKPMIDQILNSKIRFLPASKTLGAATKDRVGAFLSADLYVQGLRITRNPTGKPLDPRTVKYTTKSTKPHRTDPPARAGHTYGKQKHYLDAKKSSATALSDVVSRAGKRLTVAQAAAVQKLKEANAAKKLRNALRRVPDQLVAGGAGVAPMNVRPAKRVKVAPIPDVPMFGGDFVGDVLPAGVRPIGSPSEVFIADNL
jgi:hypothetical protein